jgi:hypothetical protein
MPMSLEGTAFLALWNDVDPMRDDEYNIWHAFEHVPERAGIEGVLSARRYVAGERMRQRYFTLYELSGLDVLEGAGYRDVVDHPTSWTTSMRPAFRHFVRQPCTIEWSAGQGHGAAISTHRIVLPRAVEPGAWRAVLNPIVTAAAAVAVHVGRVDVSAKHPLGDAAGDTAGGAAASGVPYVLLVEALDRNRVGQGVEEASVAVHERFGINAAMTGETYDLALTVRRSDLRVATPRQPPRPDLQAHWPAHEPDPPGA